jgi:hypothetical protein
VDRIDYYRRTPDGAYTKMDGPVDVKPDFGQPGQRIPAIDYSRVPSGPLRTDGPVETMPKPVCEYEYCTTENARKMDANPPEGDGWEEVHEKFERGDFSETRTWRRKRTAVQEVAEAVRPFADAFFKKSPVQERLEADSALNELLIDEQGDREGYYRPSEFNRRIRAAYCVGKGLAVSK